MDVPCFLAKIRLILSPDLLNSGPKTYLIRRSVTDVDEGSASDAVVVVEGLDHLLLGAEAFENGLRIGPDLNG